MDRALARPARSGHLPPQPAPAARPAAGILTFTVATTLLSLSAGLAITLVGIPLLAVTLLAARLYGRVERHELTLIGWSTALAAIAYPAYAWTLADPALHLGGVTVGGAPAMTATVVPGLLLFIAMPSLTRGWPRSTPR